MPLSKPKSKATKKIASSFVGYFAKLAPGNATKLERNERKRFEREPAADAARHAIAAKKAKQAATDAAADAATRLSNENTCPLEKEMERHIIGLLLKGATAAVAMRCAIDESQQQSIPDNEVIVVTRPTANLSGNVAECDKALEKLIIAKPAEIKAVLNGLQKKTITWEHRAMGAFLFLHPRIYGDVSLDYTTRAANVAAALGVHAHTLERWFSLQNKDSKPFIEKWLPIVDNMTWGGDVEGLQINLVRAVEN